VSAPPRIPYDEFALFHENASEYGLPFDGPPAVRRQFVDVGDGRRMSALEWGDGSPELVLLHGGAQNAHTWDTVAMALGRPLIAVDLPGHGHSDAPADQLSPRSNAADVAEVVLRLAPNPTHLVGMSLGGLTAIALAALHPARFATLTLVDITPGVSSHKTQAITAFVNGPAAFASFDDLLARTIEHNPTRTVASLRRGILHNAVQLDDGSWVWRYRRHTGSGPMDHAGAPDFAQLWDLLADLPMPVMLARGLLPQSVLDDSDEAELRSRLPTARVVHFARAGHSIQGDMPIELAGAIAEFIAPA
jgi:pimeloyl-ACP methyl ester carboxylesterase